MIIISQTKLFQTTGIAKLFQNPNKPCKQTNFKHSAIAQGFPFCHGGPLRKQETLKISKGPVGLNNHRRTWTHGTNTTSTHNSV